MLGVWPNLLILSLILLMGLVTLGHVVTARHPRRHLCTLIPVSTVCIVGIIRVLHYVALLTLASNDALLKARLQWDYTSIDIVVLSFLWRFCVLSSLNTAQTMKAFVYFVLAAVGRVTMKSIFLNNRLLAVVPQQYSGVFKYPLVETFLYGLSVEYFLFYLPAFITMCFLYHKRSAVSLNETGEQNEDLNTVPEMKLRQAEDMCIKCETMSPLLLLDMVAGGLALMMLLVRPLYVLSCYLIHDIPMDLNTTYCLFPFYVAVCFVNVNEKWDRSLKPHSTLLPEVPNIYVKYTENV